MPRLPRRLVATALLAAVLLPGCSSSPGGRQGIAGATASASAQPSPDDRASGAPSPTRVASRPATPSPPRPRASSPAPVPRPAGRSRYAFPVQGCSVTYAHVHHDYPATDILAPRGCRVVSPVTGTVDEVTTVDRWSSTTDLGSQRGGLSFSVIGVDGVRYYGSHLGTIVVHAGEHVTAGQRIGTIGNTGDARGTASHLHFGLSWPTRHGIWWVRRGEVYPWPYLDSWRAGGGLSPAAAVAAAHRRLGDVPPCQAEC